MYTLWIRDTTDSSAQDICIYNDESTFNEYKIVSASLNLQEGSAGALTLKIPATNVGFDQLKILTTEITIKKNGAVYWIGRLLNSSEDFYRNLTLTFEGIYNYLMDTVIPQQHYVGHCDGWVRYLLDWHNYDHYQSGEYWKIIQPGTITLNTTGLNEDFYSDFETISDLINNACEGWGGHPTFTYELRDRFTYRDYNADPVTDTVLLYDKPYYNLVLNISTSYDTSGNVPTIKFGENLEDYTKELNTDELATVILPRGGTYTDEQTAQILQDWDTNQKEYRKPIEGLDYYCTVYSANNNDIYMYADSDKLAQFGMVHKVVTFDDCTDPAQLLELGQDYLDNQKWVATTITISAIDATLLGANVDEIKIGRGVYCYSAPHNLNQIYPCTAITEDLLDPSSSSFTLGIRDDNYLSDTARKADEKLKELIIENRRKQNIIKKNTDDAIKNSFNDESIWTNSELYDFVNQTVATGVSTAESVATGDAKKDALRLLNIFDQELNNNNKGYVFFKKAREAGETEDHIYEICISDTYDYTSQNANLWRWNKSGLYYITGGWTDDNRQSGYGDDSDRLRIAITADGSIVADRINVGKLDAGIIRAGYLTSQDYLAEHGGSGNPADAHFILDINNGIMMAKTGTLIFNNENNLLDGTRGSEKGGTSSFVYLSNQTTGELAGNDKGWMYVSGERSRDWMMIIGSNFGIDKYGRAFMREGIIGATGGLWNLQFFNDDEVNIQWVQKSENLAEMQYKVSINTTGSRPLGAQVSPADIYNTGKEQFICRWRLAKYDSNNNLVFYSPLYNLSPPAGNDSYEYAWSDFSNPITYAGTTEQAREYYNDIYYSGVFFPVYYALDDVTEDPDYIQDNHGFVLVQNHSGGDVRITGGSATKPKYTCYSNGRYVPGILDQYDSVRIGSGYLYCGTIGNNSSFSLSAINRTARLNVPDGQGNNFTERNDWRFTVGSRLGVTDDGTLHCYGAYLRSAIVDSTISASYVDTTNVGGMRLDAQHPEDGTSYTFTLHLEFNSYGAEYTSPIYVYLTSGEEFDASTNQTRQIDPVNNSIPQTEFYGNIECKLRVVSHFTAPGGVGSEEKTCLEDYRFTYLKNTPTTINGTTAQIFNLGDSTSWTTPITSDYIWDGYRVELEMTNERGGSNRPTWLLSGWAQGSTSEYQPLDRHYHFRGNFNVTKQVADHYRDAVSVGPRDLLASNSSRWIGGPSCYWAHGYITHIHYTDLDQTSSRIYKTDIRDLTDIYEKLFDDLRPVSYMYRNDERKVHHTGFIMEDIGNALSKNGISPSSFGAYNPNTKGVGGSINYIDIIALNTSQIQKLKIRIAELEERLDEVERNENSSNT